MFRVQSSEVIRAYNSKPTKPSSYGLRDFASTKPSSCGLRDFARTHRGAHAGASYGGHIADFRPHKHYLNLDLPPQNEHFSHKRRLGTHSLTLAHIVFEISTTPTAHMLARGSTLTQPSPPQSTCTTPQPVYLQHAVAGDGLISDGPRATRPPGLPCRVPPVW